MAKLKNNAFAFVKLSKVLVIWCGKHYFQAYQQPAILTSVFLAY